MLSEHVSRLWCQALELMLADALVLANGYLDISSRIDDPAEYWKVRCVILHIIQTAVCVELFLNVIPNKPSGHSTLQLDDFVLKAIETAPDEGLKEARTLILRMRRRDLYQVKKEP